MNIGWMSSVMLSPPVRVGLATGEASMDVGGVSRVAAAATVRLGVGKADAGAAEREGNANEMP